MSDIDAVLRRVLLDLRPDHVKRVASNRAQVETIGQSFGVEVATRGRMLLRITEATFIAGGPVWTDPLSINVTHSGLLRRTRLIALTRTGGTRATALAEALTTDPDLREATLSLDFIRFRITTDDDHLAAHITLMGASMTKMRMPPTTSYVRLYGDQREALIATVKALSKVWAGIPGRA